MKNPNPRDVRQEVTAAIIQLLENPLSFENGWCMLKSQQPHNPFTGTIYKGVNYLHLSILGAVRGYSLNKWLTFHEIRQLQGQIRKGAKSSVICYYGKHHKTEKDEQTGEDVQSIRRILKYYPVFNVQDVEGLPAEYYQKDEAPTLTQWEKDELAEALIINTGATIHYKAQNRAFYSSLHDDITLPLRQQFTGAEPFYSTAFHEIAHWTGAPHRLNRIKGGKFGDEKYAFEELVAELCAAFLCAEIGFSKEITNNAAYIQSWLTALKNDHSFIFKAAGDAAAAADYISNGGQLTEINSSSAVVANI